MSVTSLFCIFIFSFLGRVPNTNLIERFYPWVNLCNEGSSIHVESHFFCYSLQIGLLFFAADDDDERLGRYTRSMLVSDDDDTGTLVHRYRYRYPIVKTCRFYAMWRSTTTLCVACKRASHT